MLFEVCKGTNPPLTEAPPPYPRTVSPYSRALSETSANVTLRPATSPCPPE